MTTAVQERPKCAEMEKRSLLAMEVQQRNARRTINAAIEAATEFGVGLTVDGELLTAVAIDALIEKQKPILTKRIERLEKQEADDARRAQDRAARARQEAAERQLADDAAEAAVWLRPMLEGQGAVLKSAIFAAAADAGHCDSYEDPNAPASQGTKYRRTDALVAAARELGAKEVVEITGWRGATLVDRGASYWAIGYVPDSSFLADGEPRS